MDVLLWMYFYGSTVSIIGISLRWSNALPPADPYLAPPPTHPLALSLPFSKKGRGFLGSPSWNSRRRRHLLDGHCSPPPNLSDHRGIIDPPGECIAFDTSHCNHCLRSQTHSMSL